MLLKLDERDPRPLHEQVAAALRRAIADGECVDRLPPARDLAAALDVNANTVLRALHTLRDEGLLEFRRGRGVRVCAGAAGRGALLALAHRLVDEAERLGYRRSDVITMLEELP